MADDDSRPSIPVLHRSRPLVRRPQRPSGAEVLRWLNTRYGALPTWVMLVQIFLAAGWLRAASAHGMSIGWWTGEEITDFRLEHREVAVEWYRAIMLDGPVDWLPMVIGGIVLVGQLAVAVLLGLNHRPLVGLALGAFLNINFVLAGAVDPSAFYLVLGAAVALWHIEAGMTTTRCWWLTLASTVVGFTLIGSLLPQITTMDPATVIEDPAMVLTFIALLWVAMLWVTFGRRTLAHRPDPGPDPDAAEGGPLVRGDDDRPAALAPGPAAIDGGDDQRALTDTIRLAMRSGPTEAAPAGQLHHLSPDDRPAS